MRTRITYANVMSTVAVFLALATGGAYAANTVFSTDIVDGEVKNPDLATSAVTRAGGIRLGVPPPKKIDSSGSPPASAASCRMSAISASCQAGWSTVSRTWLLKSQYGHLRAQNGQ